MAGIDARAVAQGSSAAVFAPGAVRRGPVGLAVEPKEDFEQGYPWYLFRGHGCLRDYLPWIRFPLVSLLDGYAVQPIHRRGGDGLNIANAKACVKYNLANALYIGICLKRTGLI